MAARVRFTARAAVASASVATALALGPVASAGAAERIVAVPQSQYATQNVAIDQGEPLTFLNLDAVAHDVTARGKGGDGEPLFSTPLIGAGQEVPVTGADALSPGSYAFHCTVHPQMEGTLTVGGGGGGGAPKVELSILDKKVSKVRKAGELRVSVDVDTPATMTLAGKLSAGGESAKLKSSSHEFDSAGAHTMELKLGGSGKSALRGADKAKVTVNANAEDAAGNTGEGTATAKLR